MLRFGFQMPAGQPVAVIGRYALHDQIASGGMATVHFGRLLGPVGFARTVAIKRLHQQFARDPEFVSMFLDEARLAARIRHPNVVPTLDVVALSGELFLVMDYVNGVSLSRLMRAASAQSTRLPVGVAAAILVGALHGLHAAHEARSERGLPLGIVHRDVSPQNVMVGSDGQAQVLDFGVAKASWRIQTTRDGQIKGKLSYMAPEQVNGGAIGPWTDVYAAGIVLWEALANQRLFKGGDSAAVLARFTRNEAIEAASAHNELVPPELDRVIARALEQNSELRFTSAHDMADAIEASVQLASSSAVARWMQSIVHEELAEHTALIAQIEHGSTVGGEASSEDAPSIRKMLASISEGSQPEAPFTKTAETTIQAAAEQSARSQISMTRSPGPSQAPDARRGKFAPVWAGAAIFAAGLALLVASRRAGTHSKALQPSLSVQAASPPPISSGFGASTSPSSSLNLPASSAPPAPVVEADALATATSPAMAHLTVPPPKNAAVSANAAAPRATVVVGAAQPAANCKPPYIVDSRGVRHLKLACLH